MTNRGWVFVIIGILLVCGGMMYLNRVKPDPVPGSSFAPPGVLAPPASNPPPRGGPVYSQAEHDVIVEQAKMLERNRIAIEQNYGK